MARKTQTPAGRGAAAEPVLEEVKTAGLGLDEGVILTTTIALLAAVILVYLAMGRYPS